MLNQRAFEEQHESDWRELENALDSLERGRWKRNQSSNTSQLPTLYSALCQQHSIAQSRGYSHALVNRLHNLITRAHHQLYQHRGHLLMHIVQFLGGGFSRRVRAQWKLLVIASALFLVTALICGAMAAYSVDYADLFMGSKQRFSLEQMYSPENAALRPENRADATNLQMFGFYIMNNISIDFRIFASGILYCIGSIFFLVFNGVHIGAAAGHLSAIGYNERFWGFVAGHSAPELIAMCISGVAGLMLGMALIRPGRQTRRLALLRAAKEAVPLIMGAGLMTLVAAFIEAYWSAQPHPLSVKLTVGAMVWILLISYLCLAGRNIRKHG